MTRFHVQPVPLDSIALAPWVGLLWEGLGRLGWGEGCPIQQMGEFPSQGSLVVQESKCI